jgi:diguanylate cyclase (GGDEF)-like protein
MKPAFRPPLSLRLTSVGRLTMFGTLACMAIAVLFNFIAFIDLPPEARLRGLLSAVALPILIGTPLFFRIGMRMRQLSRTNLRLDLVSRTDSLTACLNRGAFIAQVDDLLTGDNRPSRGALLMVDADNFKAVNDIYGHSMGDEALTIIARSIRAVLRSGDLVGRMGGEEFAVFLPEVSDTHAELVAERIRRAVNLAVFQPDGRQRPLSVSVGGVAFERHASFHDLFRIADQRLYGAKQAGRNRSVVVSLEDHPFIDLKAVPAGLGMALPQDIEDDYEARRSA